MNLLRTAPYSSMTRPTFSGLPSRIAYGQQFTVSVTLPTGTLFNDLGGETALLLSRVNTTESFSSSRLA